MQPPLPGLQPPQYGENRVLKIAHQILNELHEQGLLTGVHAISAELILQLAQSAGNQLAHGKPTIAAVTAVKQMAELLATLPTESAADPAQQLMNELAEAARRE